MTGSAAMGKVLRILLVEDSEDDGLLLREEVRRGGYDPFMERVDTAEALRNAIKNGSWDIIISDYSMPQFNALNALQIVRGSGIDLPFIVVSGKIGEDIAVAAMKAGAHDYLMKNNLSRLVPAIEREIREAAERAARRKVEQEIRQGKMEWEAAFDSVSDMIVLTDLNGRIMRTNRQLIEHLHTTYHEVIGRNIAPLFYGEPVPDPNWFSLPANRPANIPPDYVSFPSVKGWFSINSYPMCSPDNSQKGYVHIIKDMTRKKRLEEEKKVTDRELLTLYAVAFRLNSKREASKIFEDLLFQLHNMMQIDFSAIHMLNDNKTLDLKASMGLSERFAAAVRSVAKDDQWVARVIEGHVLKTREMLKSIPPEIIEGGREMGIRAWCAVPLRIGDERIGVLTVAHSSAKDFTSREVFLLSSIANQLAVLIENHTLYEGMKEQTRELQRKKKQLRDNLLNVKRANIELGRLNAAKNTFIGMASHELKTPITSILGGVQFLLNYADLKLPPEQMNILNSVYEGIQELRNLVDDLLSFSRIEASGMTLQKKPLHPVTLCRSVLETFALPLSRRNIRLRIDGSDEAVMADESFMRLVVRNLLENAIKFTPDGGSILLEGAVVRRSDLLDLTGDLLPFYPAFPANMANARRYYRLDIADSGIGIPEDERTRVFEKFYGVGDISYHSSGKTEFMSKGTGLGLSIVKGIMDAHKGCVWVGAGAGGEGSVFSLFLPMGE